MSHEYRRNALEKWIAYKFKLGDTVKTRTSKGVVVRVSNAREFGFTVHDPIYLVRVDGVERLYFENQLFEEEQDVHA